MNSATQATQVEQVKQDNSFGTSFEKLPPLKRITSKVWEILREKDSPHKIALGLALGIFIGFLPIMGIQMAVVALFALPLRGNLKAAIAGVWISNPITVIPLYWINYLFGTLFFPVNNVSWEVFVGEMKRAANWDWTAIKASVNSILQMGTDMLIPLWLGSAILAVVFGCATYFVTLRWIVFVRNTNATTSEHH